VAELDALGERAVLDLETSDAADADDTVPGADASEAEAPGESERRRLRDFARAVALSWHERDDAGRAVARARSADVPRP